MARNQLNVIFKLWNKPKGNKKKGVEKNTELVDRDSVVLVNVTLTKTNRIDFRSKKQIAELRVGFKMEGSKLVYTDPSPGVAV